MLHNWLEHLWFSRTFKNGSIHQKPNCETPCRDVDVVTLSSPSETCHVGFPRDSVRRRSRNSALGILQLFHTSRRDIWSIGVSISGWGWDLLWHLQYTLRLYRHNSQFGRRCWWDIDLVRYRRLDQMHRQSSTAVTSWRLSNIAWLAFWGRTVLFVWKIGSDCTLFMSKMREANALYIW